MSAKGSLCMYLYCDAHACAKAIAEEAGWAQYANHPDGMFASFETDNAGYLEAEMQFIASKLESLDTPWKVEVVYDDYENDGNRDGAHTEIFIEDGRITTYRESEYSLVDKPVPEWLDGIDFEGGRDVRSDS